MSATTMRGKPLADRIRADVAEQVRAIGHVGLITVLVGDDPASEVYIRLKHKAANEAGFDAVDVRLPAETSEESLLARLAELNVSDEVDAILVQLPLPDHIDEEHVIRAIEPAKDVDGLHPLNAGELYLGRPAIVSATPRGVMALLAEHEVPLEGARAVVIGRSAIVGKPMAHLLLRANATVTVCHSRTRELTDHTRSADVLVVAVGSPALVDADMVRAGAVVVDVGMNRTEAGLVGDVDPAAFEVASAMTPVPGGVGPLTIACLLENAVRCARYRRGDLAYP
ncbi:MAG TPA: bifunctional 5,10-methylenetetrahydrofolate dehydrogenase/5,10-methenyltetrahydrofolate cyclohydrolase [Gaiellaceae bacterium]|jgi:methylenetetrahydrofolate dehydrogenase (NADP+)/methenyltetrahydrofolate cyclohydrolase|nr:bifunctional 5,10-methylenetetrahydrofolate dehydrogenase/5,10-methenyltetrahydrofolate cyclohydrolase [Gaiellaceae bacterium]